eukprot:6676464-Prymnesium_polylepis.1
MGLVSDLDLTTREAKRIVNIQWADVQLGQDERGRSATCSTSIETRYGQFESHLRVWIVGKLQQAADGVPTMELWKSSLRLWSAGVDSQLAAYVEAHGDNMAESVLRDAVLHERDATLVECCASLFSQTRVSQPVARQRPVEPPDVGSRALSVRPMSAAAPAATAATAVTAVTVGEPEGLPPLVLSGPGAHGALRALGRAFSTLRHTIVSGAPKKGMRDPSCTCHVGEIIRLLGLELHQYHRLKDSLEQGRLPTLQGGTEVAAAAARRLHALHHWAVECGVVALGDLEALAAEGSVNSRDGSSSSGGCSGGG